MSRKGKEGGERAPAPESPAGRRRLILWGLAALVVALLGAGLLWRAGNDGSKSTEIPRAQREVDPAVYELLEQVQAFIETRRFAEGLEAVDAFLESRPADPGVFYARGLLHLGKLSYQEAIESLSKAVELDPGHPDSLLQLGIAYSRIGALDDSNRALERSLELQPDLIEARLQLGRNLARQGSSERALRLFESVAEELPAKGHYELGLLARQQGDLTEAEASFRRTLAADPKHLGATSNLGQVLKLAGRLEEGDRYLERHVQLEAERYEYDRLIEQTLYDWAEASSYVRLAAYELDHGKLDMAAKNFHKALAIDESSAEASDGLGRTYLEMGNLSEAGRWLARAVELDPENPGPHFFLGLVRHLEGRFEDARTALDRSRQLAPWGARELLFLGNALFQTGAMEDARLAYEQSLAEGENPEAHRKLALLHYLGDRLGKARYELERVLELQPQDIESRMFLGIVTFRLSDLPAARQAFGMALDRHALTLQGDRQVEVMLAPYSELPESAPALAFYRQLRAQRSD